MNIRPQNWLPLIFVRHLKQNLIVFGGHLICINIPLKKWTLHLLYDKGESGGLSNCRSLNLNRIKII
jgi:hypothetical protein